MRTADDIRGDFLLSPAIAHLNHGSFGATPRPVLDRQSALRRELEAGPVEFLGRTLPAALDGVRAEVAAHVGVADPRSLVLVTNATTALNAVAASFPLRAGDVSRALRVERHAGHDRDAPVSADGHVSRPARR